MRIKYQPFLLQCSPPNSNLWREQTEFDYASVGGAPEAYGSRAVCLFVCLSVCLLPAFRIAR